MTERGEELTKELLRLLALHLGQQPERPARRISLSECSPTMLAAWARATQKRSSNGLRS
jgi:hypothetical protein